MLYSQINIAMKTTFIFCIILLLTQINYAQTKLIAYKSHSGLKSSFFDFLADPKGEHTASNFGVGPAPYVKNAKLDSVIRINEHQVVMVTSNVCVNPYEHPSRQETKWYPGRDTTYNHHVFTAPISVDSMRSIIKSQYYFKNYDSETVFIGFDESQKLKIKKERNQEPTTETSDLDSSNLSLKDNDVVNNNQEEPKSRKSRMPKGSKTLLLILLLTAGGLFGRTFY